jgi:3-oxoacyl-[acyl-carrier-protein] synthase-3
VKYASLGPIAVHLPEKVESNDLLAAEFPQWDLKLIESKTGVRERHIAAPDECSSDLGVAAGEKLFRELGVDRRSIDFLLFCTQTPDYPLPTTACLLQDRLKLRTSIGAYDFNLGCSGYVYGLAMADGLIRGGMANRVLLITAETYSKFIDRGDRSLRTIFGDGAAATLIDSADEQSLFGFVFGTDGRGADTLIVNSGGARTPACAIAPRKRKRWASPLYMDGPSLMDFTIEAVPQLVEQVLDKAGVSRADIDLFLLHQATFKMLDQLRQRMQIPPERLPIMLERYGNTVSSTLPILIDDLRQSGRIKSGAQTMLVGFGVGYSWAGCIWRA